MKVLHKVLTEGFVILFRSEDGAAIQYSATIIDGHYSLARYRDAFNGLTSHSTRTKDMSRLYDDYTRVLNNKRWKLEKSTLTETEVFELALANC